MKLEELLRHVADNVENGKPELKELIYNGRPILFACLLDVLQKCDLSGLSKAPRMVRINGIEVKAGMSEAPEDGEEIYVCDINNLIKADEPTLFTSQRDSHLRWLEQGLIHRNYEDFKAMTEAMLSFEEA